MSLNLRTLSFAQIIHLAEVISIPRKQGSHNLHCQMGWKYQGCADHLQFALFCQLSKNPRMTALGVNELLPFAPEPFLQATGTMDSEGILSFCEGELLQTTG